MKFLAILNREVPLNNLFNALGHMSFGMGHRLNGKLPSIEVLFASPEQVREFRTQSLAFRDASVITDFPHTMVGKSTDDLIGEVTNTPEPEVNYFAAGIIADEIPIPLLQIRNACQQVNGYQPRLLEEGAALNPPEEGECPELHGHKITMVLRTKASLGEKLNAAVAASLSLGACVPHDQQFLLNRKGEADNAYGLTNIAWHSFIIAHTSKKYPGLDSAASKAETVSYVNGQDAFALFGEDAKVNALTKGARLVGPKDMKLGELQAVTPVEVAATGTPEQASRVQMAPVADTQRQMLWSTATSAPSEAPTEEPALVSTGSTSPRMGGRQDDQ